MNLKERLLQKTVIVTITPERASEILHRGRRWSNYSAQMTEDEVKEVRAYWDTLPGWTSFYTALCRIAHGEHLK